MAHALALGAESVLLAALEALRALDERGQLAQTLFLRRGAPGHLVVPLPGGAERAPGERAPHGGAELLVAAKASSTSSWYAGRASRRCSNWPDIAISRSVAAARSSRAIARPQA